MNELLEKGLIAVLGAGLSLVAVRLADDRKDRTRRQEKLEGAYVRWLTANDESISIVEPILDQVIRDKGTHGYGGEQEHLRDALKCVSEMSAALNECVLYERNRDRLRALNDLTELWRLVATGIRKMVDHLDFHRRESDPSKVRKPLRENAESLARKFREAGDLEGENECLQLLSEMRAADRSLVQSDADCAIAMMRFASGTLESVGHARLESNALRRAISRESSA